MHVLWWSPPKQINKVLLIQAALAGTYPGFQRGIEFPTVYVNQNTNDWLNTSRKGGGGGGGVGAARLWLYMKTGGRYSQKGSLLH